jgi:NAD(P)-dependent dehydrogenase (short-subunit alcohol dehydrogenase family)
MRVEELFSLEGRVAVVTGASRGLGRACAGGLAAAGARVVLAARSAEALGEAAEEVRQATGRETLAIPTDVTRRADVEQMVGETVERFGRLDILVNNAGMAIRKTVQDFSDEEWQRVMDGNLTATMLCSRAAAPAMIQGKWGRIITFGSTMAAVTLPGRSAYSAAKAAILLFTKALALELAPHNIHVNAICPGPFRTSMTASGPEARGVVSWPIERVPLCRVGEPKELVGPLLLLASEASSFMTGSVVYVDGGWTSQ